MVPRPHVCFPVTLEQFDLSEPQCLDWLKTNVEGLISYCMLKLCTELSLKRLLVVFLSFLLTQIDLAIDGADEVDADLNLIKGGG